MCALGQVANHARETVIVLEKESQRAARAHVAYAQCLFVGLQLLKCSRQQAAAAAEIVVAAVVSALISLNMQITCTSCS